MKSKNIILVILVIALLLIVGIFLFKPSSQSNTNEINQENSQNNNVENSNNYEISIENFEFSPKELRISKGSTVTWTNKDSVKHTVTSDSGGELNSNLIGQEESYSHTFNDAGTYSYHCTPHPYMKATIIVE